MKYPGFAIGIQLAATLLIFIYIGYRLDLRYHKSPLFLILGIVIGFIVGFYNLVRELKLIDKNREVVKKKSVTKKTRWM